ncbi:Adenine-specific DNA methylase, N12 class [Verrucomicrobium sp. GAS474]|uniref:DEAD/DEAH box helicase family protein n=1 Tax=Verrucomicrobium sp. GAS474 TaxID=1882831 RepID=UPI00087C791C|nr:DEAD/DEAH box helicase family protein [Verrucomicrobium sp. GAS474]SDT90468.1 Adenine-specific DNA methylase, N12 class [Verrucomicrobium sp. GAS474]
MGDRPHSVYPPSAGSGDVIRNAANHRITAAAKIGTGGPKQRFKQNVAAIETLRRIEVENRPATPEEKAVLVKYVGWGGLPQVFSPVPEWRKENEQLSSLLTDEEFDAARGSTLNAHYTAPGVVRAMYAAVERLGFGGGRILEPACGLGHFLGLMPETMAAQSPVTGIELDSITARLAQKLYPDADIRHTGYEKAQLADGFYDLAISNVPFGDYQPYDKRFKAYKFNIHDYFFAATVERIRPGGLICFITSKGTLDKKHSLLRRHVAKQADLAAAIRLPNTAFKENANTEVTTDIVILRKRLPGQAPSGPAWQESVEYQNVKGERMLLNEYFAARPEQMLGTMALEGTMYGSHEPALVSDGRDLEAALAEAVGRLPEGIYQAARRKEAAREPIRVPAPGDIKPHAFALIETDRGTRIGIREGAEVVILEGLSADASRRIRGMVRLRNAVRACLHAQVEDAPESEIVRTREWLNQEYDRFHSRFGPVSERMNARAFSGDPDLPLLLSLEQFDEIKRSAKKTAIFRERTIQRQKPAEAAGTAKEALLISLNENGKVDLAHMSWLLKRPVEEFLPELKGVVFLDPQTDAWEPEDAYLSGNIREKLAVAEAAAVSDPRYAENVVALKAVQPEDLKPTEIEARLGSAWIPSDDIQGFAHDLLKLDPGTVKIRHAPELGAWTVQADYSATSSVANVTEWGMARYSALHLIEDALNLRTPTVYDPGPEKDTRVINPAATEAAREMQQRIKERFTQWIWEDDARRERLARQYNDEYNNVRIRTFDGNHLTLPGVSPLIQLRSHQKAAVWRILQTPNSLLAHVVGAGKTYTMVAAGMESKRLGLAQKPMFVVPNHMLGQFSSELLTLYPGANVLAAGKDDFETAKRQELFSRIATGNWDAVIVTHSGFERIPMAREVQERFIKEQIDELEMAILRQKADKSFARMVKELERAKKRLEGRLETLAAEEKKDNTLTFEELGVDRLFVDEAHYFKNLFYVTKMTRVAGLPQTSSQRAFDMFLKVRHLQALNGGGGVVFATGTPVTNTMAEMFTMQRYLQHLDLSRQGLQHFDSWAATFGEPVTAMELSPDGAGYRLNTRFARFVNVPELMQQFRQMADIQTAEMLELPVPKLFQGRPQIVSAPATPALRAYVASLVKRAEKLRMGNVDPSIDNMLKITGDGRKAALDLRLVGAGKDHPESKLSLAAKEIFSIWEGTKEERLAQLVFCDLSTPQPGGLRVFSAYEDLRDKLVRMGVPAEEIAFIQDYEADAAKSALFKRVRSGQVRVLLGSTQKMGTGTNVQERLIALHHLDAPWRPADIEQREGRILRQGNRNTEVKIFRYVTEGSFDAYMWGVLETKAKFIGQIMTKQSHVRKIEDLDSPALTYAEVKAIASGNPLVLEKAKVDAEVMRLTRLRAQHREGLFVTRNAIRQAQQDVPRLEEKIGSLVVDLAARQNTKGDAFVMKIEGRNYTQREMAGETLNRLAQKHLLSEKTVEIGAFAGFTLQIWPDRSKEVIVRGKNAYAATVSESPLGTISSLEYMVRSMDERAQDYRKELETTQKRIVELRPHADKPFEHEEKLQGLVKRQQEIMDALDLEKNQASNRLDAEVLPVVEEAVRVEEGEAIVERRGIGVAVS